jgi:general secretion pathway protein L
VEFRAGDERDPGEGYGGAMERVLTRPHHLIALFFRWWVGELAALLPRRVRQLFRPEPRILVIHRAGGELILTLFRGQRGREVGRVELEGMGAAAERIAVARLAKRVNLNKTEIAIRLPADQALHRTLELPWAVESELRRALHFQVDRQTPFTPDEAYFDYRITRRDPAAKQLTVEMTVVPRPLVDDAVAAAGRWGLDPAVVDVAGEDPGAPPRLNLLAGEREEAEGASWSPLNAVLALAAAVLLAVAVYLPLERQRTAAETLLAGVAEAKAEADEAIRLRDETGRLRGEGRFLIEEKRKSVSVPRVLDELTRLLPDHTWLFELKVNGQEVTIAGYSSAASALIGLIEDSPLLETPRFRSPVTQDRRSGLERFNLSFLIEGGGADR